MFQVRYLFFVILFTCGILALSFAVQNIASKVRRYTENRLLALASIGSGIWSLGFCVLYIQADTSNAYYFRSIGMVGVFLFLISVQFLVYHMSEINAVWAKCLNIITLVLGIPAFIMSILPGEVLFMQHEDLGMSYYFKPGLPNVLYTLFTILVAINVFLYIIHMIAFSKSRRLHHYGIHFLLVGILVLLGMILDTIFPVLGIAAIPGSTLTQFWGLVIILFAARTNNHYKINIANMSEFIYSSLSTPVLVYDAKGALQISNKAAADFFQYDPSNTKKENILLYDFFPLNKEELFLFDGQKKTLESVCSLNQAYCDLSINKIYNPYKDVIGYIIVITDQTDRHKAMLHMTEAQKEAEAANHAKSTFLANMSHEIRTPMNAIIGFTELILKEPVTPTVRDYMSDIKTSALNLLSLINDILDISKLEAGKMELSCQNYFLSSLLQNVFHVIDVQAKQKGLSFHMNVDPDLPNELYGDKDRIRGVLINILNNAVKYTEFGSVDFEIEPIHGENFALQFQVIDTGIGIRKSVQAHLFDTFSQFDRQRNKNIEGTGLGLAIAKGFTDMMEGTISVDSVYGEGTTFTIIIPQKVIDSSPMKQIVSPLTGHSTNLNENELSMEGHTVLVVDDNAINIKVIKANLEQYDFTVDTAASGPEAIYLCKNNQYDIVFMDQMMPQMDGIEAMKHIRALSDHYSLGSSGKIVALTANAIHGVREQLLTFGFDDYLVKPINFSELERILTTYIDIETEDETMKTELSTSTLSLEELLPELNVEKGKENCGGMEDVYKEVLEMIITESPSQLQQLKQLHQSGNQDNFTIQIHSLKGQLLNIGYESLGEDAKKLEYASRDNDTDYINSHLVSFIKDYDQFVEHLQSII